MNCVAIIILAHLAIISGSPTDLSGNSNYATEELDTCPLNSSINVKVFRNSLGEWLTTYTSLNKLRNFTRSMDLDHEKNVIECRDSRYIRISGFLKDTEVVNSSGATVGDYRNNVDGEAYDSCQRSIESPTTADNIFMNKTLQENLIEARKSSDMMKIMDDRMTGVEDALTAIDGTLKERHASVENTLMAMKETINQLQNMLKNAPHYGYTMQFDATLKGKNIELSSDFRTAKRTNSSASPLEDAIAGVISNVHLQEDVVFQIRIDEAVRRWSRYGMAIGVIKDKREEIQRKWSLYNNIKGTWAIYSGPDTISGKTDTWKDNVVITQNEYPLDTRHLPVGTILGVSRRKNGDVHFYQDGVDKGPALRDVPKDIFAFVDVIHYVTKISIPN